MDYALTVNRGLNKEDTYTNPSPEMIELAIDELIPVEFHFAILEKAEKQINDYWYIQTAMRFWGEDTVTEYNVETHYLESKGFAHFRHNTTDSNEVKKLFRMFALGISPDTTNWIDRTDEIKKLPSLEKQWEARKKRKEGNG